MQGVLVTIRNNLEKGSNIIINGNGIMQIVFLIPGMGYRLVPLGKDTIIYNSNNNYIEEAIVLSI